MGPTLEDDLSGSVAGHFGASARQSLVNQLHGELRGSNGALSREQRNDNCSECVAMLCSPMGGRWYAYYPYESVQE